MGEIEEIKFVADEIVDAGKMFGRPFYVRDDENGWEELHRWYNRNWIIGLRPKLTRVKRLQRSPLK